MYTKVEMRTHETKVEWRGFTKTMEKARQLVNRILEGSLRIHKWIVNCIHAVVIIILLFFVLRSVIYVDRDLYINGFWESFQLGIAHAGLIEWFTYIGAVAFILFGITGIYDFAYLNGIRFIVPPIYITFKDKALMQQAEKMMELYYEKDLTFITLYEEKRTSAILQSLGLTEKQFHSIRYEVLKARAKTAHNLKTLEKQAQMILLDNSYIIDLTEINPIERKYFGVDYYIDLYTAFHVSEICQDACDLMCNFMFFSLKEKLEQIDYIIVPYDGNITLGLVVGRKLQIPVISVLGDGRFVNSRHWDGNYEIASGKKNKIVVINDVLVSGRRVYESVNKLPDNSYELLGTFFLIYYESKEDVFVKMQLNSIPKDKIYYLLSVSNEIARKRAAI